MNEAELLRKASAAWIALKSAESQISRLNGYEKKTPAMKDDYRRHCATAHESRQTLDSILKVRS